MPTTDSNLTGTFIANTYQKLLQIDNQYGSVGTTATFNVADAVSGSKYTLLNGLGQKVPGFVVDTTGNGNGGIMFKDQNSDPGGLWSIQTYKTSNNEGGLNFWRPASGGNTDVNNAKLFLKNTGSVWIGYENIGAPVIPTDVINYSLYVKNGIQVGQNTTGNNGRINLIGANPLENGAGMFINGEHPFRIYRYQVNASYIDDTQRFLEDENGQKFSTLEWTALVVGQQIIDFDGTVNSQIGLGITLRPDPSGYWEAYLYASNGDSSADTKLWIWDVMMIKKGFYQDRRLITLIPINLNQ